MVHAAKLRNVAVVLLAAVMMILSMAPDGFARHRRYRYYQNGHVYYTYSRSEYEHHHSTKKGALVGGLVGAVGGALVGGGKGAVIGAGAGAGTGYLVQRHRNRHHHNY
jgi:hypothetical protein